MPINIAKTNVVRKGRYAKPLEAYIAVDTEDLANKYCIELKKIKIDCKLSAEKGGIKVLLLGSYQKYELEDFCKERKLNIEY